LNKRAYKTKSLYFSPRLLEQLAGIREHPLTIVQAPMGYGKTTAVKHFLSGTGWGVLWQKVYDDSIDNFWDAFARLLGELNGGLGKSLAKIGFPDDALSLREALRLLSRLELHEKCVLVIDDYHLVENPRVSGFIAALAQNEVYNLHIVLTGRFIKLQQLEELSLKGLLKHITKEDLALTTKEIIEYFALCGVLIGEKQSRWLHETTEGWISALYLILLNFIEDGVFETPDSIYKLIEKIIYIPLPDPQKELLIMLSVFDNFSLEQATFMWDGRDAGKMLAGIVAGNAFVYYESRSKTYQIHSIFKEHLSEALRAKGGRFKNGVYQKAAQWYRKIRNYTAARKFWYACRDFESILGSVEEEKAKYFTKQNMQSLQKYFEDCPSKIKKRHHYALLILSVHFILHNAFEPFLKALCEAEENISQDASLSGRQRRLLLGEVELMQGVAAFNDLKKMAPHFENAWRMLGRPTLIYDVESDWTFGSSSPLYLYYRESGKLKENLKDLQEALPCYENLTGGNGSGGGDLMQAEWHYYSGDFLNAEIRLHKAVRRARPSGQWGIEIAAWSLQARIDLMRGNFENMFRILKNMRRQMENRAEYGYLHNVELCELGFYSWLDQKTKIPENLARPESGDVRLLHASFAMFNMIYGRVMLINEQYAELLGSAEYFLQTASFYPNMLSVIYTYIYMAAANRKINRAKQACEDLKKAMDIAMPDGLLMPFVENGDYIEPLIADLAFQGVYKKEAEQIFKLYEIYAGAKEKIKRTYFPEQGRALSPREKEVASLAARGFTNKEIADRLFISQNTVKYTLKSVFLKLSIHSRVLLKEHFKDSGV